MLEFEPGLFIWTIVSFGLLVVLLYKVALPPLLAFLAQREKMIADSLVEADENRKRSEDLLAEYKKKLAEVHKNAEKIIAGATEEGRKAKDEIISKASHEADRIIEKAKYELVKEKNNILVEAQREIVGLVAAATGRVLQRVITADEDKRLIEQSLKEIKL
jgi:F-type H+-transporting ATPase subunit b